MTGITQYPSSENGNRGIMSDGRTFRYSGAHNGYVFDDEPHERVVTLTDTQALEQIAEMLRDPEWGMGMLEDIRDLVQAAGRSVENYEDERPTWDRH